MKRVILSQSVEKTKFVLSVSIKTFINRIYGQEFQFRLIF